MSIPKDVGELTIRQFQELLKIQETETDPIIMGKRFIKTLTGKTEESLSEIARMYKEICLMLIKMPSDVKYEFSVNGKTYKGPQRSEKLNASQYIDLKNLSVDYIGNLHLMVAVIYQPSFFGVTKKYDGSKLPEIANQMLDAKVEDVYCLLFFYSSVLERLNPVIQTSLDEAQTILSNHMTEIMNDSEFLQSVGAGDISSTNSQPSTQTQKKMKSMSGTW